MNALIRITTAAALAAAMATSQAAAPAAVDVRAAAEELAQLLEREYLFPDIGARYAAALRARAAADAWAGIADPEALAAAWDGELRAVHADAHLRVLPADPATDNSVPMPRMPQGLDPIGEPRWLANGVAYLPIQLLPGDETAVRQMAEFLDAYEGAETLVLDLRACLGGTLPVMDELFSRIYREPTRLVRMDMRDRESAGVERMFNQFPSMRREDGPAGILRWDHWAIPKAPAGPWAKARIFVLTDVTASACEHLSYALKLTGRATLIGATTRGAGHFGAFRRFGGQFEVFVPVGRTYDVASGLDWETTGIAPHRAVAPADALKAALTEAGIDPATVPEIEPPRPPVRVVAAGSAQLRYGIALLPPRGGETALPIMDVPDGTIAARAGLKRGDRILRMNGVPVAEITADRFPTLMRGSPLELVIERDGVEMTFRMSLDAPTTQ